MSPAVFFVQPPIARNCASIILRRTPPLFALHSGLTISLNAVTTSLISCKRPSNPSLLTFSSAPS
jgi:hypothetical protein